MTTLQTPAASRPGTELDLPTPRRGDMLDMLAALEPTGDTPLHLQLRSVLDFAVDASGLDHGERIWSESQLMRHYGVSRHVVRQALNQLVLEGRLSVRKGAGYFVNRRRVVKHLPAGSGGTADLAPKGEPFSVQLLDVGTVPAADELEEALAARRHRPRVHRVRRIGLMDGEPVALLIGAYPTSLSRSLTRHAVSTNEIHELLSAHGRRPFHADVLLSMTFASAEESVLLQVADGAPLVCVRNRTCTEDGELVEVTRELYRSDRFVFCYSAEAAAAR